MGKETIKISVFIEESKKASVPQRELLKWRVMKDSVRDMCRNAYNSNINESDIL